MYWKLQKDKLPYLHGWNGDIYQKKLETFIKIDKTLKEHRKINFTHLAGDVESTDCTYAKG